MKKRNLTKIVALALCLSFALSTVTLAKSYTNHEPQTCNAIIHPEDGELPRK